MKALKPGRSIQEQHPQINKPTIIGTNQIKFDDCPSSGDESMSENIVDEEEVDCKLDFNSQRLSQTSQWSI